MGVGWTALSRPRRPAAGIWPLRDGLAVACLGVEGVHRVGPGPRHVGCVVRGWRILLAGGSGGGFARHVVLKQGHDSVVTGQLPRQAVLRQVTGLGAQIGGLLSVWAIIA